MNTETAVPVIQPTGEATGFIPAPGNHGKPITVIGTAAIRDAFDAKCIEQALNSRGAPGVTDLVLNPDAHCRLRRARRLRARFADARLSRPVGVDIKCSMSLLQLDLPVDAVADKTVRRALINAIVERTPTGAGKGQRNVKKGRNVNAELVAAWQLKAHLRRLQRPWHPAGVGSSIAKMPSISATATSVMISRPASIC